MVSWCYLTSKTTNYVKIYGLYRFVLKNNARGVCSTAGSSKGNQGRGFLGGLRSNNLAANMVLKQVNRKMSMTLYKSDYSPPARAVMMVMDILGLKPNMEDLNPVARDQDEPEFVKMNPMRTIPILDEGDFSLGDSHAIMLYLVEKYGKPKHSYLYPEDIRKRATIHQRLFFECGILFPRLRAIMAPTYKGKLTELTKNMVINIEDAFQMLEDYLSQSLFIADDVMTVADLSVFTTTQSLDIVHPADEQKYPNLCKWLRNMYRMDVVKRVNEPHGQMHGKSLLMFMAANKENQAKKSKL